MDKGLEIVDTEDKFYIKIDGKEIPYITEYSITAKTGDTFVELSLKVSIPNGREVIIESKEPKVL